jgi:hypothetical protein
MRGRIRSIQACRNIKSISVVDTARVKLRVRLAPKALFHGSLGHRPRNPNRPVNKALKARFNWLRRSNACCRRIALSALGPLNCTINPGALPQAVHHVTRLWR